MKLLKRKIDRYLLDWKNNPKRKPLIVKGARQIGKTESIRAFAKANYESVIEINFVLQKKFRAIFDAGYEVETIIKNISLMEPTWRFIPQKTLIFFDELQKCPDCATSLKSFCQDGRYDVICSGSLMGIYYEEIESNAVGFKDDFDMFSMDFEEFLWAKGYQPKQVEDMYRHMVELKPFSQLEMDTIMDVFRDYMSLGGMPEVVKMYIDNGHFGGTLELQRQLLKDYEEDITKYAKQTDKAKLLAVYSHISTFLAKDNKKYQITKIAKGARNRICGCRRLAEGGGCHQRVLLSEQRGAAAEGQLHGRLLQVVLSRHGPAHSIIRRGGTGRPACQQELRYLQGGNIRKHCR